MCIKFLSSASPKFLNLNQDYTSKKRFFCSNLYEIEVMTTSLVEMPELPYFGHMTDDDHRSTHPPTHAVSP